MPRLTSRVFIDLAIWMAGLRAAHRARLPALLRPAGAARGPRHDPALLRHDRRRRPRRRGGELRARPPRGRAPPAAPRGSDGDRRGAPRAGRLHPGLDRLRPRPAPCRSTPPTRSARRGGLQPPHPHPGPDPRGRAAMRDFSGVLSSEFELEGLGDAALDGLLVHTGADAGAILVVREDAVEPLATHGLRTTGGLAERPRPARPPHGAGRAADRGGAGARHRLAARRPARPARSSSPRSSSRACRSAPSSWPRPSAFDPDAIQLIEQFRADLGLAINNALAHDRLERLAAVDPLTDAYNRRFGLARLREEYSRAVRAEARSASSCSTSTTSRRSTTPTATWSATACCGPSPGLPPRHPRGRRPGPLRRRGVPRPPAGGRAWTTWPRSASGSGARSARRPSRRRPADRGHGQPRRRDLPRQRGLARDAHRPGGRRPLRGEGVGSEPPLVA